MHKVGVPFPNVKRAAAFEKKSSWTLPNLDPSSTLSLYFLSSLLRPVVFNNNIYTHQNKQKRISDSNIRGDCIPLRDAPSDLKKIGGGGGEAARKNTKKSLLPQNDGIADDDDDGMIMMELMKHTLTRINQPMVTYRIGNLGMRQI